MRSSNDNPTYERIGDGYDLVRRADPYLLDRLHHWLGPRTGGRYLDAGCGTGNYTALLAERGGRWYGADQSARMLAEARGKSTAVTWLRADILDLPFDDGEFDGVVVTLVLHHLPSLAAGMASLARVLAPEARLVLFTSTAEQMEGYWLNHYFPEAMRRSIEQMPRIGELETAAAGAGLVEIGREPYAVSPALVDSFLYRGKHHPRLYLDPRFRNGASTFSSLADPAEVEEGCRRLAADLETDQFARVAARYLAGDSDGDYVFLTYCRGPVHAS